MEILSVNSIRSRIKQMHPRTLRVQLNTIIGLISKGGGVVISLLLVPLTIDYLNVETYGTWLTISSIVMMFSFLDIGIGNGLRNKLSEAISRQDIHLAQTYISSAYFVFACFQLVVVLIFLIIYTYLPWQVILNTKISNEQLQISILIVTLSVLLKMIFDILQYVLFAIQQSGLASIINLSSNFLILVNTYILMQFCKGSIIYLSIVTAICPIIVILVASFILYNTKLKLYRPSFKMINLSYVRSIFSLGYQFFLIQIAVIVLFYTDNLIISQLYGATEVTVYHASYKYFNVMVTLFSVIITPFWSAFTEAYVKNDTAWMQRTYKYLLKIWLFVLGLVVCMVLIAEPVYKLWLGNRVIVPISLNFMMAASVLLICWNNAHVSILNGLSKIRLQLICSIFAAVVNIPLAIYLSKNLNLGLVGVTLATSLSLLPAGLLSTIQARKLITNNARSIWAK